MLLLLSPSKALNFAPPPVQVPATRPELAGDIALLAERTKRLRAFEVKRLMSLSDRLAELNRERFQAFDPETDEGLQAAFAFNGDVYNGLQARTLDPTGLKWIQDHVRILSGLYGILRPLDAIQPYRLEMGTRLKTKRGSNLYDFWGDRIAQALNAAGAGHNHHQIVNLASQEYFGAVDAKTLAWPVVTCRFLEEKDGEARMISFYAKKARGLMARYAADHRAKKAEDLKDFNLEGYRFQPSRSRDGDWVFSRPQPAGVAAKKAA